MRKSAAATAAIAVIALTATACGDKAATPHINVPTVRGVGLTIQLDPGLSSSLAALQITPSASGAAHLSQTALSVPIASGHFATFAPTDASPPVQGELVGQGGLQFAHGATTVTLTNLKVELTTNPQLVADVQVNSGAAKQGVDVAAFGGLGNVATDSANSTYTISGVPAYLSADGATTLNQAFSTTQLKGGVNTGLKIGTAAIVISAQRPPQPPTVEPPSPGTPTVSP